jgi:hypothetical protein
VYYAVSGILFVLLFCNSTVRIDLVEVKLVEPQSMMQLHACLGQLIEEFPEAAWCRQAISLHKRLGLCESQWGKLVAKDNNQGITSLSYSFRIPSSQQYVDIWVDMECLSQAMKCVQSDSTTQRAEGLYRLRQLIRNKSGVAEPEHTLQSVLPLLEDEER